MSEPFVGEIRMFAGNFAPRGWAYCDGQLLAVSQNDALFSLFGTIYGGDGRTTFGLPDLRGRIPIHAGQGPGLSPRPLGQKAGAERVSPAVNQLPSHGHVQQATGDDAETQDPTGALYAKTASETLYRADGVVTSMQAQSVADTGGSQSHDNVMPFLCVHFIVALFGIYPSRH
jgi:microcystin-dependent protein